MADAAKSKGPEKKVKPAKAEKPVTTEKSDKPEKQHHEKPEKPDEEAFKAKLTQAEKEHAAAMEKLNAIREKVNLAQPAKGSPTAQRQSELRSQLAAIRTQQQGFKTSKGSITEKIKVLDATLKARIAEQNAAKSRIPFKNVEEIDREIARLEKQVDSGSMKLVDEKKALADISSLRKQRKGFAAFDETQKAIDDIKAQIKELKKGLDDPESRALSEKYTAIANELDSIKAEQDEAYKNINSLRDERTRVQAEQQEKYTAIRTLKDEFYAQKKAYSDYEHQAFLARKERQKAERESYERERRKKIADKRLEEASEPAYMDEILTAEGLIRYFDPTYVGTTKESGPSKFAAQASRTVDDSNLKGTKVLRKEDREDEYFKGTGGKKSKKGKKGGAAKADATAADTGKFNLSMGVIEELAKVGVEPPMGQSDVPAVVEQLKEKLEKWKKDQDTKTKENIAKAQKEIEKLENESLEPPTPTQASSGRKHKENGQKENGTATPTTEDGEDKVAEAADGVEKASIKDEA